MQKSLLSESILDLRSMEYQETWFRSPMMAQESEKKSWRLFLQYIVRRRVGKVANNSISLTDVKELKRL